MPIYTVVTRQFRPGWQAFIYDDPNFPNRRDVFAGLDGFHRRGEHIVAVPLTRKQREIEEQILMAWRRDYVRARSSKAAVMTIHRQLMAMRRRVMRAFNPPKAVIAGTYVLPQRVGPRTWRLKY
jgi:hypothetical protein